MGEPRPSTLDGAVAVTTNIKDRGPTTSVWLMSQNGEVTTTETRTAPFYIRLSTKCLDMVSTEVALRDNTTEKWPVPSASSRNADSCSCFPDVKSATPAGRESMVEISWLPLTRTTTPPNGFAST